MGHDWTEQAIARLDAKNRDKLAKFLGLTPIASDQEPCADESIDEDLESKGTPAE